MLLNQLDEATEWLLDLDDGDYHVSVVKSLGAGGFSDVTIISTARGGHVDITTVYLEGGTTRGVAGGLLDPLSKTINAFVCGDLDPRRVQFFPSQVVTLRN